MAGEHPVGDALAPRPVVETRVVHEGRVFDLRSDVVDLGDGGRVTREYLDHPGAVAIVALDADERVLLLRQYRHPVRRELWEVPAGLLDVVGEDGRVAAARELAEEVDLRASRWDVLVDYFTTPGGSNEALRVFLARDLSPVPDDERFEREAEELDMELRWVPLDDAVAAVLGGALHNPSAVVGILAAATSRAGGWTSCAPPTHRGRSAAGADADQDRSGPTRNRSGPRRPGRERRRAMPRPLVPGVAGHRPRSRAVLPRTRRGGRAGVDVGRAPSRGGEPRERCVRTGRSLAAHDRATAVAVPGALAAPSREATPEHHHTLFCSGLLDGATTLVRQRQSRIDAGERALVLGAAAPPATRG